MPTEYAIGIDLGTTRSCVGVWEENKARVEIIPNEMGNRTTPSCVAFNDEQRLIGDAASGQIVRNAKNTVFCIKRLMGRTIDEEVVQSDIHHWPFRVSSAPGEKIPLIDVQYQCEKRTFRPEQISAMILEKMKAIAAAYLGVPESTKMKAVITIPAYFNDAQRMATKQAGEIAGLEVIRTLAEPTAAAIAYGIEKAANNTKILVFDLGGGTFDVSILSIEGSKYKVKATSGDDHLGGEDFNRCLVEHFAKEFKEKKSKDPFTSEKEVRRLYKIAEDVKHRLSASVKAEVDLDLMGEEFSTTIMRARFDELCKDNFKRCIEIVENCLKEAKVAKEDVTEVLLVGGSTRIPKIQQMLQDFFNGKALNKRINPDEVVAYGAAVQAANLSNMEMQGVEELVLYDVTPLSLGVGSEEGHRKMSTIIPRQAKFPIQAERSYVTLHDYQTSVKFPIYQGEHDDTRHNKLLGEVELRGIRPAPAGEIKFTVTFKLDEDGILWIEAQDTTNPGIRKNLHINMGFGRLTADEIQQSISDANSYRVADEFQRLAEQELHEVA